MDCSAVIDALNGHWQKLCGRDYEKNDEQVYNRISHLTGVAIKNAQWVHQKHHDGKDIADANSSTEVYLLVRRLLEDDATSQE
jgi:hypothetical protein